MAALGRPSAPDDPTTRMALGNGLVLMASVFGGFALAYALSFTLGGIYVPFAMPVVVGFLLGAIGGVVGRRFDGLDRRAMILAGVLGAAIAYVGYHALAYLRVIDVCAAQWAAHLPPGVPAADATLALIEESTGREGFAAYLAFVSEGSGAALSPLGMLGRSEPGLGVTIAAAIGELLLAMVSAAYAMVWRTRAAAPASFTVAIDDRALSSLRDALVRLDWAAAGRALAMPGDEPRHVVTLTESGGVARLEVRARGLDGRGKELEDQRTIGETQAHVLQLAYGQARRAAR